MPQADMSHSVSATRVHRVFLFMLFMVIGGGEVFSVPPFAWGPKDGAPSFFVARKQTAGPSTSVGYLGAAMWGIACGIAA